MDFKTSAVVDKKLDINSDENSDINGDINNKFEIINIKQRICNTWIRNDNIKIMTKKYNISNNYDIKTIDLKGNMDNIQFREKYLVKLVNKSDILTDVYEGGLKIWECSIDLSKYVCNNMGKSFWDIIKSIIKNNNNNNINIIELGCGHALPMIAFMDKYYKSISTLKGNVNVFLQDLNYDVINCITIPNVFFEYES